MTIPLTKDWNATIVSAYTPAMANPKVNKEIFYSQLKHTLRNIPSTDKLLLIGDFNARIGRENDKWPSALGKYGIWMCNSNGELLLALFTEFELIVTNTMFKQKDAHNTTWTNPCARHGHMTDFITTRCRDKMVICSRNTSQAESLVQDMSNALAHSSEDNKTPYTLPLKHISAIIRRVIKTGSTQMTRCYVI